MAIAQTTINTNKKIFNSSYLKYSYIIYLLSMIMMTMILGPLLLFV